MPAQRKPAAVRPRNRQRKKVPAENRAIRPIFLHQNVNAGKNRSIIPIYPRQNIKTRKNRCICPVFSPQSAIKRENRSYTPIFSPAAVHSRRQTCLRKYAAQSLRRPSGTVWPRGQNQHPFTRVPAAMRPCPVHPAASINEPPAPHRERQVAAKGGMLQTRSRPQSCGFRPPVLSAAASWSTIFRRRPALLKRIGPKQNVP